MPLFSSCFIASLTLNNNIIIYIFSIYFQNCITKSRERKGLMKSTKDFWSKKQFDNASQYSDHWLISRTQHAKGKTTILFQICLICQLIFNWLKQLTCCIKLINHTICCTILIEISDNIAHRYRVSAKQRLQGYTGSKIDFVFYAYGFLFFKSWSFIKGKYNAYPYYLSMLNIRILHQKIDLLWITTLNR